MSKSKNSASKKAAVPVSQNQTTELRLVRLLQDDLEWDLNPIANVETLLDLFDIIDKEDVLGSPDRAKGLDVDDRDEEALLQDLDEWLKEQSSCSTDESKERDWLFSSKSADSNKSRDDSKGNRIIAVNDIAEGKVIMTVNRSAMFCARFGTAPCLSIAPLIAKFSDNVTLELTVLLLYHINIEDSFFRPYLKSLPKVFSVPAYWDLNIFKAFNGSLTMKRAIGSLKSSAILFLRARQTVKNAALKDFPSRFVTWNKFRWCLAAVMTRQNNVPLPEKEMNSLREGENGIFPTLVPGWDLMNHEEGVSTSHFDVALDSVVYPAMKAFPKGTEVTMCYGARPNDLLFVYSGFCIENNPNDSLDTELSVPRDEISRVRDLLIKSFSQESDLLSGNVGSIRSAIDGILMYSVNKKDNGKIPINAFYAAAVSVMKREEATLLMKIKAQNTRTEQDLFENIKNQLCSESIEKSEINGKNGKNYSDNSKSNSDGNNYDKSVNEKIQNYENSLKHRTLNFLHSTLSLQRKNLILSLNHRTFRSLSKELKTPQDDRNKKSDTKINSENNIGESVSAKKGSDFPENKNNDNKNNDNNDNNSNNDGKSNSNMSNRSSSEKDEKTLTDFDEEEDSGSDSRSSKNILLSCKYLLQGQLSIIDECLLSLDKSREVD